MDLSPSVYTEDESESTQVLEAPEETFVGTQPNLVATLSINGISHNITLGEHYIGRNANNCDIVINNKAVSSIHAVIEVLCPQSHFIYDWRSCNKTKLGKFVLKPNVRYFIRDGDEIWFANVRGVYTYANSELLTTPTKTVNMTTILETPEHHKQGIIEETPYKGEDISQDGSDIDLFEEPAEPSINSLKVNVLQRTALLSSETNNIEGQHNKFDESFTKEINNGKLIEHSTSEQEKSSENSKSDNLSIYDMATQAYDGSQVAICEKSNKKRQNVYDNETQEIDCKPVDSICLSQDKKAEKKIDKEVLDKIWSEDIDMSELNKTLTSVDANVKISDLDENCTKRSILDFNTQELICKSRDSDSDEIIFESSTAITKKFSKYSQVIHDQLEKDVDVFGMMTQPFNEFSSQGESKEIAEFNINNKDNQNSQSPEMFAPPTKNIENNIPSSELQKCKSSTDFEGSKSHLSKDCRLLGKVNHALHIEAKQSQVLNLMAVEMSPIPNQHEANEILCCVLQNGSPNVARSINPSCNVIDLHKLEKTASHKLEINLLNNNSSESNEHQGNINNTKKSDNSDLLVQTNNTIVDNIKSVGESTRDAQTKGSIIHSKSSENILTSVEDIKKPAQKPMQGIIISDIIGQAEDYVKPSCKTDRDLDKCVIVAQPKESHEISNVVQSKNLEFQEGRKKLLDTTENNYSVPQDNNISSTERETNIIGNGENEIININDNISVKGPLVKKINYLSISTLNNFSDRHECNSEMLMHSKENGHNTNNQNMGIDSSDVSNDFGVFIKPDLKKGMHLINSVEELDLIPQDESISEMLTQPAEDYYNSVRNKMVSADNVVENVPNSFNELNLQNKLQLKSGSLLISDDSQNQQVDISEMLTQPAENYYEAVSLQKELKNTNVPIDSDIFLVPLQHTKKKTLVHELNVEPEDDSISEMLTQPAENYYENFNVKQTGKEDAPEFLVNPNIKGENEDEVLAKLPGNGEQNESISEMLTQPAEDYYKKVNNNCNIHQCIAGRNIFVNLEGDTLETNKVGKNISHNGQQKLDPQLLAEPSNCTYNKIIDNEIEHDKNNQAPVTEQEMIKYKNLLRINEINLEFNDKSPKNEHIACNNRIQNTDSSKTIDIKTTLNENSNNISEIGEQTENTKVKSSSESKDDKSYEVLPQTKSVHSSIADGSNLQDDTCKQKIQIFRKKAVKEMEPFADVATDESISEMLTQPAEEYYNNNRKKEIEHNSDSHKETSAKQNENLILIDNNEPVISEMLTQPAEDYYKSVRGKESGNVAPKFPIKLDPFVKPSYTNKIKNFVFELIEKSFQESPILEMASHKTKELNTMKCNGSVSATVIDKNNSFSCDEVINQCKPNFQDNVMIDGNVKQKDPIAEDITEPVQDYSNITYNKPENKSELEMLNLKGSPKLNRTLVCNEPCLDSIKQPLCDKINEEIDSQLFDVDIEENIAEDKAVYSNQTCSISLIKIKPTCNPILDDNETVIKPSVNKQRREITELLTGTNYTKEKTSDKNILAKRKQLNSTSDEENETHCQKKPRQFIISDDEDSFQWPSSPEKIEKLIEVNLVNSSNNSVKSKLPELLIPHCKESTTSRENNVDVTSCNIVTMDETITHSKNVFQSIESKCIEEDMEETLVKSLNRGTFLHNIDINDTLSKQSKKNENQSSQNKQLDITNKLGGQQDSGSSDKESTETVVLGRGKRNRTKKSFEDFEMEHISPNKKVILTNRNLLSTKTTNKFKQIKCFEKKIDARNKSSAESNMSISVHKSLSNEELLLDDYRKFETFKSLPDIGREKISATTNFSINIKENQLSGSSPRGKRFRKCHVPRNLMGISNKDSIPDLVATLEDTSVATTSSECKNFAIKETIKNNKLDEHNQSGKKQNHKKYFDSSSDCSLDISNISTEELPLKRRRRKNVLDNKNEMFETKYTNSVKMDANASAQTKRDIKKENNLTLGNIKTSKIIKKQRGRPKIIKFDKSENDSTEENDTFQQMSLNRSSHQIEVRNMKAGDYLVKRSKRSRQEIENNEEVNDNTTEEPSSAAKNISIKHDVENEMKAEMKNKQNISGKNSEISDSSVSDCMTRKSKKFKSKKVEVTPALNLDFESPRRSTRDSSASSTSAQPERVMFTGIQDAKLAAIVTDLGGELVDNPLTCTVVVTDKVRRTVKFLCGLARGKPIVSPKWLRNCKDLNHFCDYKSTLLADKDAELKFSFNLKESISKAKVAPLLVGWSVYTTPSVKPPPSEMKSIVECSGGTFFSKLPTSWTKNSVIISCLEDKGLWSKFKKRGITPPILSAEVILSGILQQLFDIEKYKLK